MFRILHSISFIIFLPIRFIAYIWFHLSYLLGFTAAPSPKLSSRHWDSEYEPEWDYRSVSPIDTDDRRIQIDFETWNSPPSDSYSPPRLRSTRESVFTVSVRPHRPNHFEPPQSSQSTAVVSGHTGTISAPSETILSHDSHNRDAGQLMRQSRLEPESISLPPRDLNLLRQALRQSGIRGPGVVKPLPFESRVKRTSKKLRETVTQISFYRTRSDVRIDHPTEGGNDAQEGDIYLNWVDSEILGQLWLRKDGAWVKVAAGHRALIPPETEERYLAVTLGGQPTYVRRGTWVKAYKWGQREYCPAI